MSVPAAAAAAVTVDTRAADAVGDCETRSWAVGGLHCAACALQLRDALLALPGVRAARVGFAAGVAVLEAPAALQRQLATQPPAGLRAWTLAPLTPAAGAALREAESRQLLWRLFVAGFCMMQIMMLAAPTYFAAGAEVPVDLRRLLHLGSWTLSWPVLLFSAQPFFVGAWRALRQRRIGMDLPVALALAITFAASSAVLFDPRYPHSRLGGEVYFDSLSMFAAFLLAARWLELKARHAAAADLARLLAQPAEPVARERADGGVEQVPPAQLRAGDVIHIGLGEALPVDGWLLDAEAALDESLLSGESRPVRRQAGECLQAGSLNLGDGLRLRAAGRVDQGCAARLGDRLQAALTERPEAPDLAERLAGAFLLGVLLLAAGAGLAWLPQGAGRALEVLCAVLIVTCPCAFALAAPAARVASHRALARQGVLLQRLQALETLAQVDRIWLDKTGTLTRAQAQPRPLRAEAEEPALQAAAASLAGWSRHPVAQAVARSAPAGRAPAWRWQQVQERPGVGLRGLDPQGRAWCLRAEGDASVFGPEGEPPWLAFRVEEALEPGAARWLRQLREARPGLRIGLLSGDQPDRVQAVATQLGLDAAAAAQRPEAKQALLSAEQAAGHRVLMVGDGLNDAPALAQADVSVAVAAATPLAAQAADVRLLQGGVARLPLLLSQARRTVAVMRQNLAWAAAYNLLAVPLALAGALPPWAAGLGMALSSLLVVGNALRLSR